MHNGVTHGEGNGGYTVFIEMDCTLHPHPEQYECMNTRYALSMEGAYCIGGWLNGG
jgi:hypothetical protein